MLVPLSWLKDYVDINISADELEKKLFDCGFEVEEKWQVGKDIFTQQKASVPLTDLAYALLFL